MRFLSAGLWTTIAAALLAGCSGGNGSSPSTSVGSSGLTPLTVKSGPARPELMTVPKYLVKKTTPYRVIHKAAEYTRGIAVSAANLLHHNIIVYPKDNSDNGPLTCTQSTGDVVNDMESDPQGNLIVPDGFSGVLVYGPPFTYGSCGTLLGSINEPYGQATSASASDAVNGKIVVGNIGGGRNSGVVTCTLSSQSCTPLVSPNMGQLASVAMDDNGNCYADAFDQNGNVGLWVYNNCAGTGNELTSADGFSEQYYGGMDVDSAGNLVVVSLLNSSFSYPSTVTVYSGCNTGTCTVQGGPFNLQGESEFGHLGYESERWTTVDIKNSAVEVYAYNGHGSGLNYLYSFNNGLSCATNLCESAAYMPGSKGL
jgi:hypothetical protein